MIARHAATAIALCATCAVATASAGGLNIAWNDCLGAGGTTNKSFACDASDGASAMVVSFEPPTTIAHVIGGSATVDLRFATRSIPAWWQLAAGSCREGTVHSYLAGSGSTRLGGCQGQDA